MNLPTFQTNRLTVRPRQMQDLEACLAMDRDHEVTKYITGPWNDKVAHRAFVTKRIAESYPAGLGYWSVFLQDNPEHFLGWILLIPDDAGSNDVEIGWRFVREAWGCGYATEAATPIILHAFKTAGLPRVIADIDKRNAASIKLAKKLGLRLDDRAEIGAGNARYVRQR